MSFKSKLGNFAMEDFTDPDVTDKSQVSAGEPESEDPEAADPDAAATDPAADTAATPPTDPAADAAATDSAADPAVDPAADPVAAGADPEADPAATDPAATTDDAVGTDPAGADAAAAVSDVDGAGDPPTADDATGDDADPDAAVVEEEMEGVDEIEEQESDVNDDVEKLQDATESLEVCVAALESAIERGGLDIIGSVLMRNNINTVTRNLKVQPLMIPALEDMESPDAKIQAGNSLKDQLVQFINRIIDAIKSAFDRFASWAVDTYKRLTNAFSAIEHRAQTLATKVKTSVPLEGKIDNAKLVTNLAVGGKTVENISVYLASLSAFAKYLNDPASYKNYLDAIDECEQLLKTPEKSEEIRGKISEILGRWAQEMEKHSTNITQLTRAANTGGGKVVAEAIKSFAVPLLGNQTLNIFIPDSAEGIRNMASVVNAAPVGSMSGNLALEPLDQAEATKVCQLVEALAKQTRESGDANKGGVKELMTAIKTRKDTITALAQNLGDNMLKSENVGENARKVILFINGMLLTMPKLPVHGINRALPRNLTTALDYVAASLGGASDKPATGTAVATV